MRRFMCALMIMIGLMCIPVYAADYKTDINNYTFEGQELIPEQFRAELKKTAEYNKKYVNSCYNEKESYAEEFALMYNNFSDSLWGTNYSVPYDELERMIKKEMGIQDNTSRITGEIVNVY